MGIIPPFKDKIQSLRSLVQYLAKKNQHMTHTFAFNWSILMNITNDIMGVALIQAPVSVTLQMSQKAGFLFCLWHIKQTALLCLHLGEVFLPLFP